MAFSLDSIFTTITAVPPSSIFTEIEPPPVLKPYIRCFWTCDYGMSNVPVRIIPDFCADIIFDINNGSAKLIGVGNGSFMFAGSGVFFGIRFYAWAVRLFANAEMSALFNSSVAPENVFKKFAHFKTAVIEAKGTEQRVELATAYLLDLIDKTPDADVMNCLFAAIKRYGNISTSEMASYAIVSKRTLERKFKQSIGIAPKTTVELLRYQLLWQDCVKTGFSASDGVDKFGYYDQAHMYNDFKKYHGLGLSEAQREFKNLSHIYNTKN